MQRKRNSNAAFTALSSQATEPSDDVSKATTTSKQQQQQKAAAVPAASTTSRANYAQAAASSTRAAPPQRQQQQQQQAPRKPRLDPYPGKSREDRKKFYAGDEPPAIRGERSHPVYYNYYSTASWDDYISGVQQWVRYWWNSSKPGARDATEDCILSYVSDLRTAKHDDMRSTADKLMAKMKTWFPNRKYELLDCTCLINRNETLVCSIWMPTQQRPVKSLLDYFLKCWNDRMPREHRMKSTARFTVYVDDLREDVLSSPSSSSGPSALEDTPLEELPPLTADELSAFETKDEEDERLPKDAVIVNEADDRASYADILAKMGLSPDEAGLVFRQQWAIERYVRFNNLWYSATIDKLAKKTASEDWGGNNWILRNVVNQTVVHQLKAQNICQLPKGDKDASFYININLIDQMSDPLYMRLGKYEAAQVPPYYYFQAYVTAKDVPACRNVNLDVELPRPRWFKDASDLMFDPALDVKYNTEHILSNNRERIEKCLRNKHLHPRSIENWLSAELPRQLNAAKYNHRLCTPQYYSGEIQLLLPLYKDDRLVLAATVSKVVEQQQKPHYLISTVLEPSWAYNNARLLSSIESNWLLSSLAKEDKDATDDDEDEEPAVGE